MACAQQFTRSRHSTIATLKCRCFAVEIADKCRINETIIVRQKCQCEHYATIDFCFLLLKLSTISGLYVQYLQQNLCNNRQNANW